MEVTFSLGCVALFLVHLDYALGLSYSNITAQTVYGSIKGYRITRTHNLGDEAITQTVDRYLGIPYAQPPVKTLRFEPPRKVKAWTNQWDARFHRSVCPQIGLFTPATAVHYQSEDCLYLNMFSPKENEDKLYPVMVFIHGGSFEVGSGKLFDGEVLAKYGVVVITINYRLGALGFLASGNDTIGGNFGIQDQIAALNWVQENVKSFRGDPDKVTIFGQSAGGASVGLMLVVPEAHGLFHGVIAQSGSATASYGAHAPEETDLVWYTREVAKLMDCPHDEDILTIKICLQAIPHQKFIDKRQEFPLFSPIGPEFTPFVDGKLIPKLPKTLFEEGKFAKVPYICGTVRDEFGNYFNGGIRYKKAFDIALDNYVAQHTNSTILDEMIRYEYTDWTKPLNTMDDIDKAYDRGSVLSDMHMVAPTVELASLLSANHQDVYQYVVDTPNSYHSVELNYVFGSPFSNILMDEIGTSGSEIYFDESDEAFSRLMMKIWTDFAKYGTPTPPGSNLDWEKFNPTNRSYLNLSPDGRQIERHLRAEKVALWNNLLPRLKMMSLPYFNPIDYSRYEAKIWTLIGICSILLLSIVGLTFFLVKYKVELKRYQQYATTFDRTKNVVPTKV